MKIICDDAIPFIEGRLEPEFQVKYLPGLDICHNDLTEADALLVRTRTKCNAALLKDTPVKIVATATIGMDHYNLPELEALGIEAVNSPGCNAPAVAQYVWSTLLRSGFDPERHTLGVVGKGNVGSIVVDFGRRLGANVIVCDPPRSDKGLTDENYLSLEELAARSDAVSFHTPLTRCGQHPSYHMASDDFFGHLREGAIVVNAARGGVVDEEAWLRAINDKGIIAVVDTWEGEPAILHRNLLKSCFIASPHIAGYSRQGKERATRMVLEALERKFGVAIDKSGLEGPYQAPEHLNCDEIMESYDPAKEMLELRSRPSEFEIIRETYPLREEYKPSPARDNID